MIIIMIMIINYYD